MKPTLGPVRQLPRQNEFSAPFTGTRPRLDALVLLEIPDVGAIAVPALEITRDATLKLVLAPTDAESAEQLSMLRNLRLQAIGIAYNLTATRARVKSARDVVRAGVEQIELELIEEEPPSELGTEMSYNNISADELATMRARRILLDEKLAQARGGTRERLALKNPPFPLLAAKGIGDREEFLAFARLFAVLLLRLSGVVERILRFDLQFDSDDTLAVDFIGVRAKVYSNVEPSKIEVTGTCKLRA